MLRLLYFDSCGLYRGLGCLFSYQNVSRIQQLILDNGLKEKVLDNCMLLRFQGKLYSVLRFQGKFGFTVKFRVSYFYCTVFFLWIRIFRSECSLSKGMDSMNFCLLNFVILA